MISFEEEAEFNRKLNKAGKAAAKAGERLREMAKRQKYLFQEMKAVTLSHLPGNYKFMFLIQRTTFDGNSKKHEVHSFFSAS